MIGLDIFILHLCLRKISNVNNAFFHRQDDVTLLFFLRLHYFRESSTHKHLPISSCLLLCRITNNKNTVFRHAYVWLRVFFLCCLRVNRSASNIHTYTLPFVACRFFFYGMKPTLIHSNVNALDNFPRERKKRNL